MTDKRLIPLFGQKPAKSARLRRSSAATAFGALLSLVAACLPTHLVYAAPVEIGELKPFYRSMQMQGSILGHGLIEIPAYLTAPDIDIRYRKNPNLQKEIPFVDSFTINRFLGGYKAKWLKQYDNFDPALGNASLDYVIRDAAGKLKNRPEIIRLHLQPYIDAGYKLNNITINLENIPWAIARNGGDDGLFGQRNPPGNIEDWKWLVSRFSEDLKTLYGNDAAPNFKIGNEFNTKKSFNGTADEYLELYTSSYKILHENFPKSAIVPGEFTGNGTCRNFDVCVYDIGDLLKRVRPLGATPRYVPRSLHAFQNFKDTMPSTVVQRAVSSYRPLGGVTAEVHQFSIAGQPFGAFRDFGSDMGPRQAAWQFQVLMGLEQSLRPSRVFHWGGVSGYPGAGIPLLNGAGFLRLFLDRYLGAKMYRLQVTPEHATDVEIGAVAFSLPNTQAVIVGSFGPGTGESRTKVAIEMPSPGGDLKGWKYTRLDSTQDVFMAIRRDLAAAGNLKPQFDQCPTCTAGPQDMAVNTVDARKLIISQREKYERIIQETLRWKPLEDLQGVERDPRTGQLRLELAQNELLILESPGNMR